MKSQQAREIEAAQAAVDAAEAAFDLAQRSQWDAEEDGDTIRAALWSANADRAWERLRAAQRAAGALMRAPSEGVSSNKRERKLAEQKRKAERATARRLKREGR